jgi:hypothetical protein
VKKRTKRSESTELSFSGKQSLAAAAMDLIELSSHSLIIFSEPPFTNHLLQIDTSAKVESAELHKTVDRSTSCRPESSVVGWATICLASRREASSVRGRVPSNTQTIKLSRFSTNLLESVVLQLLRLVKLLGLPGLTLLVGCACPHNMAVSCLGPCVVSDFPHSEERINAIFAVAAATVTPTQSPLDSWDSDLADADADGDGAQKKGLSAAW